MNPVFLWVQTCFINICITGMPLTLFQYLPENLAEKFTGECFLWRRKRECIKKPVTLWNCTSVTTGFCNTGLFYKFVITGSWIFDSIGTGVGFKNLSVGNIVWVNQCQQLSFRTSTTPTSRNSATFASFTPSRKTSASTRLQPLEKLRKSSRLELPRSHFVLTYFSQWGSIISRW